MRVIDGDAHFLEPLDVFERYIDPPYRERAMHVRTHHDTGAKQFLVEQKPMKIFDVEAFLGAVAGYGQKEEGRDLGNFDHYLYHAAEWQDMGKRVQFLDEEGMEKQVIYPTLGLFWEGEVDDPYLADAHCRAYNTWAFELCASYKTRLFPAAHISLRDPHMAVREMERVANLGGRTLFIAAAPINGRSFGHPDFDSVWAAAQSLDLSVGLHLVGHAHYAGSEWFQDRNPGFMYLTMSIIQDPRNAVTAMMYDGVFERFPRLRVATIEAMVGWVGEWLERVDYRYKYMGHTSQMKRPASEYFARNIWVNGDPEEKMFPLIVQFAGDDRFFIGSDYPHAEGFVHPVEKARTVLSTLPPASVDKILGTNAANFYRI